MLFRHFEHEEWRIRFMWNSMNLREIFIIIFSLTWIQRKSFSASSGTMVQSYKASFVQPYKASLVVDFSVIRHELQYVILIYKRSINNSCISMLCFFYFSTFLLHLLYVKFSLRFSFLSVNISRRFSNVFRIEMYWKKSSKINWSS